MGKKGNCMCYGPQSNKLKKSKKKMKGGNKCLKCGSSKMSVKCLKCKKSNKKKLNNYAKSVSKKKRKYGGKSRKYKKSQRGGNNVAPQTLHNMWNSVTGTLGNVFNVYNGETQTVPPHFAKSLP